MKYHSEVVSFIWSVADRLRGDYKQSEYGKVILPFTVLRRLDCVLEPTKAKVLAKLPDLKKMKIENYDPVLNKITKAKFHNTSKYTFEKLKDAPGDVAKNLRNYISGFSKNTREIFEKFDIDRQITRLNNADLLFQIIEQFAEIDLHPKRIDNQAMGYTFEELIRRFSEISNETAGEHFTPREVIRLMVDIVFAEDNAALTTQGIVKTLYDPACGTGGMLSVAEDYVKELNPDARLEVFGQELNDEAYAICKGDMLLKGQNPGNIISGNSFSKDGHANVTFDYFLCNPPFGVEWKKVETEVKNEHEKQGKHGRFGAGLPRISDGSLLFLQHMLSKMKDTEDGSRIGIIFNASPLFSGEAGSGESDIRRWIIENDWLEAIIALPDQLFYNTGIFTYVWILTNRKVKKRKGKVQLVNGIEFYQKMRKSLGNKRHQINDDQIKELTKLFAKFKAGEHCKIFDNNDFGYHRITVERPLRLNFQTSPERIERLNDVKAFANLATSKKKGRAAETEISEGKELQDAIRAVLAGMKADLHKNREEFTKLLDASLKTAELKLKAPIYKAVLSALSEKDETADICLDSKGNPEPDSDLRDYENVPLKEDIQAYFDREVKPHVPDAWIDEEKTRVGYEIPFTRHFYKYTPLRPLEVIDAEIQTLEQEIQAMLAEVTG